MMPRKVFISVLGTGFYDACKYVKGSFVSSETRFIQQATLEYLKVCNNWTTKNAEGEVVDRIFILLTDGAREKNWNKSITSRTKPKTQQKHHNTDDGSTHNVTVGIWQNHGEQVEKAGQ